MARMARLALLVAAVAFWSFSRQATAVEGNSSMTTERVQREAQDAVETTKESTVQRKEAFQRKIQEELDEMQAQIASLRAKTDQASAEARAKVQQMIADLEKKKEAARKRLEELKSAGASAWADLQRGMTAALEDLRRSYRKALSHLP
ncbi:MAG TPA: hypothetical protein VNK46_06675 [Nitrospiraceae bacterium]|jgi:peptidoglycan hydrolase CwlO-like protein|nr:hypothetical protein [Nitrospiraceae bacterium]